MPEYEYDGCSGAGKGNSCQDRGPRKCCPHSYGAIPARFAAPIDAVRHRPRPTTQTPSTTRRGTAIRPSAGTPGVFVRAEKRPASAPYQAADRRLHSSPHTNKATFLTDLRFAGTPKGRGHAT